MKAIKRIVTVEMTVEEIHEMEELLEFVRYSVNSVEPTPESILEYAHKFTKDFEELR